MRGSLSKGSHRPEVPNALLSVVILAGIPSPGPRLFLLKLPAGCSAPGAWSSPPGTHLRFIPWPAGSALPTSFGEPSLQRHTTHRTAAHTSSPAWNSQGAFLAGPPSSGHHRGPCSPGPPALSPLPTLQPPVPEQRRPPLTPLPCCPCDRAGPARWLDCPSGFPRPGPPPEPRVAPVSDSRDPSLFPPSRATIYKYV